MHLLDGRSRPHVSLLARIVLIRLGAVRAANIGVRVVEVGLRGTILRLGVDVGAVRRSRRRHALMRGRLPAHGTHVRATVGAG